MPFKHFQSVYSISFDAQKPAFSLDLLQWDLLRDSELLEDKDFVLIPFSKIICCGEVSAKGNKVPVMQAE